MPTRIDRFRHAQNRTQRDDAPRTKSMGTKVLALLVAAVVLTLTGPASSAAAWPHWPHGRGGGHSSPEPTLGAPEHRAAMKELRALVAQRWTDERPASEVSREILALYRDVVGPPTPYELAEAQRDGRDFATRESLLADRLNHVVDKHIRELEELDEMWVKANKKWLDENPTLLPKDHPGYQELRDETLRWHEDELGQYRRNLTPGQAPKPKAPQPKPADGVKNNSVAAPDLGFYSRRDGEWAPGCTATPDPTKQLSSAGCQQVPVAPTDGGIPCLEMGTLGAPHTPADRSRAGRCPVRTPAANPLGCRTNSNAAVQFSSVAGCLDVSPQRTDGASACIAAPRIDVLRTNVAPSSVQCLTPPTPGPQPLDPGKGTILNRNLLGVKPVGPILTAPGSLTSRASLSAGLPTGVADLGSTGGAPGAPPLVPPGSGRSDDNSADDQGVSELPAPVDRDLTRSEEKAARDTERSNEQAARDAEIAAHQAAALETSATFLRDAEAAAAADQAGREAAEPEPEPAPAPPDPEPATSPPSTQSREPEIQETEEIDDTWEEDTWVDDTGDDIESDGGSEAPATDSPPEPVESAPVDTPPANAPPADAPPADAGGERPPTAPVPDDAELAKLL